MVVLRNAVNRVVGVRLGSGRYAAGCCQPAAEKVWPRRGVGALLAKTDAMAAMREDVQPNGYAVSAASRDETETVFQWYGRVVTGVPAEYGRHRCGDLLFEGTPVFGGWLAVGAQQLDARAVVAPWPKADHRIAQDAEVWSTALMIDRVGGVGLAMVMVDQRRGGEVATGREAQNADDGLAGGVAGDLPLARAMPNQTDRAGQVEPWGWIAPWREPVMAHRRVEAQVVHPACDRFAFVVGPTVIATTWANDNGWSGAAIGMRQPGQAGDVLCRRRGQVGVVGDQAWSGSGEQVDRWHGQEREAWPGRRQRAARDSG